MTRYPDRIHNKVFKVVFRDLSVWSVASQFAVAWKWPNEVINPLRLVLRRRNEPALDTMNAEEVVRLLTIHFDGSIEPRNPVQIEAIKGKLFRVHPGDLVFSKIDVRNGAIGLAPVDIDCMCVTSEYPCLLRQTRQGSSRICKTFVQDRSICEVAELHDQRHVWTQKDSAFKA